MNAPTASIIVPCYNEQATIRLLLEAIYAQTFPRQEFEVVVVDGMSTDGTRQEINDYHNSHPDLQIKVLDNPQKTIPSGLNTAINASRGEFIIRMDAHSKPYPDYVERCVTALRSGMGDNVGGVWEIQPGRESWLASSIAVTAAHPLGVGDAHYRLGGRPQAVDTVPFGSFNREYAVNIGLYDESLLTNEDYEFNVRIRQSGGVVWFDPEIRSIYYSRPDLASLARQYFRYGYWKGKMLQRYPETLRWRQVLPPLFILSLVFLGLGAVFFPILRWLFALEVGLYVLCLLVIGSQLALKKGDLYLIIGFPLAAATMHITWGSALLWNLIHR